MGREVESKASMKRDRIVIVSTLMLCLVLLASSLVLYVSRPLSPTESFFVGHWDHIAWPSKEARSSCSFSSDRGFRSDDGGLIGQWWVMDGQLYLRHWGNSPSPWPFENLWRRMRTPAYAMDFQFDKHQNRIELAQPGRSVEDVLIRSADDMLTTGTAASE